MDQGKKSMAIFLDLSKAFDTVSIPILLKKLETFGIRGIPLELFRSYLNNRIQCVTIDGFTSTDLPVEYGVPQGSILAPSLFLSYINDLCNLDLPNGNIISFADDTALVFSANTWNEVYITAQQGFDIVSHWLNQNLLTINVDKTKHMIFSIRNWQLPSSETFSITASFFKQLTFPHIQLPLGR